MARNTQDRRWEIDADPFLVNDEETVGQALMEAVTILTRVGGAIVIVAQREEVAPDIWHTTGLGIRWSSYAPAKRYEEPDEVELEGEPVAAGSA